MAREFSYDMTTSKGLKDKERLERFMDRMCMNCGHPENLHDERGFCVVCRTIQKDTDPDLVTDCE